ncbi:pyruvate kinase [Acidianus brierleyi]|uniref:Pyruvate kinase n=1 Tax=Acidianus brierleyi TaxID=41673 RepID=A0A2U9IHS6_9CREN|nr:pyruvate kinase [Acidianus brierleyi]AWR95579.1 pyruvate kinase [Acidianus brierleyi]
MEVRKRKTKIIATLGPSSENFIDELLRNVDIIRINLAHTSSIEKYVNMIEGRVPILLDLPGSKFRILNDNIISVKKGQRLTFGNEIKVDDSFYSLVNDGDLLTIGDGDLKIMVNKVEDKIIGTALENGIIYPHRGISLPKEMPYGVTDNDLRLLDSIMRFDPDFIGISFVTSELDIKKVKNVTNEKSWIVSKIERKESLNNLVNIAKLSDVLMIARGDLGLEVGLENIPFIQKYIIKLGKKTKKPVILATQVLESMVNSPTPVRAEVIDIANSISQGVDAIMLSDETAIGKHPLEATQVLNKLILGIEGNIKIKVPVKIGSLEDSIYFSAIMSLKLSKAKALVIYSPSGNGAIRISKLRPNVPIIALVNKNIERKLSIAFGIYTVKIDPINSVDELIKISRIISIDSGLAKKGDSLVITAENSTKIGKFIKIEDIR